MRANDSAHGGTVSAVPSEALEDHGATVRGRRRSPTGARTRGSPPWVVVTSGVGVGVWQNAGMAQDQTERGGGPRERPGHPALAGAILMIGVVVVLLLLAVASL